MCSGASSSRSAGDAVVQPPAQTRPGDEQRTHAGFGGARSTPTPRRRRRPRSCRVRPGGRRARGTARPPGPSWRRARGSAVAVRVAAGVLARPTVSRSGPRNPPAATATAESGSAAAEQPPVKPPATNERQHSQGGTNVEETGEQRCGRVVSQPRHERCRRAEEGRGHAAADEAPTGRRVDRHDASHAARSSGTGIDLTRSTCPRATEIQPPAAERRQTEVQWEQDRRSVTAIGGWARPV